MTETIETMSGPKLQLAIAEYVFKCLDCRINHNHGIIGKVSREPTEVITWPFNEFEVLLEHFRSQWFTDNPEEMYWQLTDCQEHGWRVDVMWSHHDGDVSTANGVGESLALAIYRATLEHIGYVPGKED